MSDVTPEADCDCIDLEAVEAIERERDELQAEVKQLRTIVARQKESIEWLARRLERR